jgi:hypothetical protein
VGNLWKSGLVYGFIAKDAVHRALSNERPGSFLVRFSENHAGSFAVAYKHIEALTFPLPVCVACVVRVVSCVSCALVI